MNDKDFIEDMKYQYQTVISNRNGSDLNIMINPEEFNEPNNDVEKKFEEKAEYWNELVIMCVTVMIIIACYCYRNFHNNT